jgi:hypothetical protein
MSREMKRILVGIRRVMDYNVRIRVKPDASGAALVRRANTSSGLKHLQ